MKAISSSVRNKNRAMENNRKVVKRVVGELHSFKGTSYRSAVSSNTHFSTSLVCKREFPLDPEKKMKTKQN